MLIYRLAPPISRRDCPARRPWPWLLLAATALGAGLLAVALVALLLGHPLPGAGAAWEYAAEPLGASARQALRLNSGCPAYDRKIVLRSLQCAWPGLRRHILR